MKNSKSDMEKIYIKKNQGFTLVEMIVVLMIIAIMAAIIAPSVLGYVDQAKDKQYIANAGIAVTTAQTMLSDTYNAGKLTLTKEQKLRWKSRIGFSDGIQLTVETAKNINDTAIKGNERAYYTISRALYREDGITVYYNGTDYVVLKEGQSYELVHPIVIIDSEDKLEDSKLMNR